MKLPELAYSVAIPDGVTVEISPDAIITAKGKKGNVTRSFQAIGITYIKEERNIILRAKNATKKQKRMLGSFRAHLKNMVLGVAEGYQYKLKICSGHFPMAVSVKGKEFSVKNFLGEKVPRTMTIPDGVKVTVEGSEALVECPDLEAAGAVASHIELLTFISKRDRRIFQDGIYIIEKPSGVQR